MSADGVNRSVGRKALASLLSAALTGAGKPAQAVYAYKVGDFKGQSPVVIVTSAGSQREKIMLSTTTRRVSVFLDVFTFVLYADPATGWTESDAEDRLDLLEKSISDVLVDNVNTANWNNLTVDSKSQIDSVVIGGADYARELIQVKLDIVRG